MRYPVVVQMAEVFGGHLQGRLLGKKHYARLCEFLSDVPPGDVVFLDFASVDLVTGSWVNAMLVPFLRWAADERNDLFPVICNAQEGWLDDLRWPTRWNETGSGKEIFGREASRRHHQPEGPEDPERQRPPVEPPVDQEQR